MNDPVVSDDAWDEVRVVDNSGGRTISQIDEALRRTYERRMSSERAMERRQRDLSVALSDVQSYERQIGVANEDIDKLLSERSRVRALNRSFEATLEELLETEG